MRADEIHRSLMGHFDIDSLDSNALKRLREIFTASGYNEPAIYKALDIPYFSMLTLYSLPVFLHFKLNEDTPFNKLVKLFLISQSLDKEELLNGLFTEKDINDLAAMKILCEKDNRISSMIDIYPCMGTFIATDHRFTDHKSTRAVMYLSNDSFTLARGTIRTPVRRTLDLCTGSGVQAILAARHSEEVIGVDINPRAINFSEFNRIFNEVVNVRFLRGDLFAPVEGEHFDLIVANPPFVPRPANKKKLFFRDGGYSGEAILDQILMNAPRFLTERGRCQIFTEVLLRKNRSYIEKLSGALGEKPFDILVLAGNHVPSEMYAIGHLKYTREYDNFTSELVEWIRCLHDNGITHIAEGLITLSPTEEGTSPAQSIIQYRIPNRVFGNKVAQYLASLKASAKETDISTLVPKLSDEVDYIWKGRSQQGTESYAVEFSENGLPMEEPISPGETKILELCDGERTSEKVAGISISSKVEDSMQNCIEHLKNLARKQIIQFCERSPHADGILKGMIPLLFWASEDILEIISFLELSIA
ncbi:MAG: methyltransferase [Vulcanimicrobiota bacterium]